MLALKEGVFYHRGPKSYTTSQNIYGSVISEETKIPYMFTVYFLCTNQCSSTAWNTPMLKNPKQTYLTSNLVNGNLELENHSSTGEMRKNLIKQSYKNIFLNTGYKTVFTWNGHFAILTSGLSQLCCIIRSEKPASINHDN